MKGIGIIIAVLAIPVVAAVLLFSLGNNDAIVLSSEERAVALALQQDDYVVGDVDSPVVLVEYLDYECPACAAYHPVVKEVIAQYSDRVAFVTRHFPLFFHVNARHAAYAVEAAERQGKREEMADIIFEQQRVWEPEVAKAELFDVYAAELELDVDQFVADRQDQLIIDRVEEQYNTGRQIGVNATPSFYLNGERLAGPQNAAEFAALLDAVLAQANAPVEETVVEATEEVATTTE